MHNCDNAVHFSEINYSVGFQLQSGGLNALTTSSFQLYMLRMQTEQEQILKIDSRKLSSALQLLQHHPVQGHVSLGNFTACTAASRAGAYHLSATLQLVQQHPVQGHVISRQLYSLYSSIPCRGMSSLANFTACTTLQLVIMSPINSKHPFRNFPKLYIAIIIYCNNYILQ